MELKQKLDRSWNKVKPLIIPTVILLIIITVTLLFWKFQQYNVDSLQHKIENFRTEIAQSSSSDEKLKLEERLKLEKDILVIEKDRTAIQNGVYTTIVQSIGGGIVGFTAYIGYRNLKTGEENLKVGQKNLKVTEDKQVTERFSKSIEHLGNGEIAIRLGGIYALEQIAFDSAKYHWTMVDILSAFIREKRPLDSTDPVGIDVRAALTVIGRRNVKQDPSNNSINLKSVNLRDIEVLCANLRAVDLGKAILIRSNLSGSTFTCANLSGANLGNAILSHADLRGANLTDTDLSNADLSHSNLNIANLSGANLGDANLSHTLLWGADLSTCKNLTIDQLNVAITNENTTLPN